LERDRLKADVAGLAKTLEWIGTEASPPIHGSMDDMQTINAIWEVADKALVKHREVGGAA
jgi:hypothetical protein